MQPAISANGLQKSYKKVQVLKNVSFTVQKGTIFALLGTNGAGKTTVINILTTLLKPDQGTATVGSFNTTVQADNVRKLISLTGQFAAVDDILTARENLTIIGELRRVEDPKQTTKTLLEQFQLTDAADRRVATFSGGMRRRIDIAMSLIGNPSIIFLDEPTTGLDPQSRNALWQTIQNLARAGTTVFLTTQYLMEADRLADKIAVLNHGEIVAEGTASELKKLLSHGTIQLKFLNQKQLALAGKLLPYYQAKHNKAANTLTLTTDGSVKQVADIFSQLQAAHIEVVEFLQKEPTLDDVFIKIVDGDNGEQK